MENNNDQNFQPMTLKDWIITDLLLLIPFANIVLMFVWAFGGNVNKSKKTYFQAQLIFGAVIMVLYIIIFVLILATVGSSRALNY